MNRPFSPAVNGAVRIAATTASANVTLNANGTTLYVYNGNNQTAFVELGGTANINTSLPIPTGGKVLLDKGGATVIAAITAVASNNGNVTIVTGTGNVI